MHCDFERCAKKLGRFETEEDTAMCSSCSLFGRHKCYSLYDAPYRVLVREWVCCGCPEQRRTLFQEEQYVYLLGYGLSCCNKDTKSDSGSIEIDAASSLSEQSRGGPRWALIRSVLTWPSCCVAYPRLSMSSLSPRLRLATTIPSMSQCRGRGKERSRDSPFPL